MTDISTLDFEKLNGIIPAVVTDCHTGQVLMVGFMNKEAAELTITGGKVTFFSRTKNRLWTKGETSGNYLYVKKVLTDCDSDTLLIEADPAGNTCHLNRYSCFGVEKKESSDWLYELYALVKKRKIEMPEGSYTTKLFQKGTNRIIQKVGEEAIETVIAAKNRDKEEIINEVSDLFYHIMVMLAEQEIEFSEVVRNLEKRHK